MPRPPAGKQKKPKKNPFGDVEEEEPKPRKLTAEERRAEKAAEREEEEQWMGKRAPRRVPRGDGDESTGAPTVASAKTFDVAPSNAATVASSNSGGHSGDHSGDATVASSQNLGDLSPLTAAPTISFDDADADADGESVQSPFDRG